MNQILLLATLALGSFSLIDAKPTKAGSSQRPLVCQINSDIYTCPTGSSCSGDSVTLTYNGVDYDVTVCQKKGKGKGNDVSSSLVSGVHFSSCDVAESIFNEKEYWIIYKHAPNKYVFKKTVWSHYN